MIIFKNSILSCFFLLVFLNEKSSKTTKDPDGKVLKNSSCTAKLFDKYWMRLISANSAGSWDWMYTGVAKKRKIYDRTSCKMYCY